LGFSSRKAGACSPYGLPDSQISCTKEIPQTNCDNHFDSEEAPSQQIFYQKQLAKKNII
jgi:hypothetical protein